MGEVEGTVPSYTQDSGSNYCWAASAWCVGETLNPLKKTVEKCVTEAGGSFGGVGLVSMQKYILSEIYKLPSPTFYEKISQSSMTTLIDRNDPFIMLCFKDKDNTKKGHSVTCYKYDDSTSPIKLKVMDSLVAIGATNWRWMVTPASGNDYSITSNGITYTYVNTLTPREI